MIESKTLVIGSGNWGTAFAMVLARANRDVTLYVRNPEQLTKMQESGVNQRYLPDIPLPANLKMTNELGAIEESQLIVLAIPTNSTREMIKTIKGSLNAKHLVLSLSKGIERKTGLRISQILVEELGPHTGIAVLSGPNIAVEIAQGKPAVSVVSSAHPSTSKKIQKIVSSPTFRIYTNPDLQGVEICGSLKNIIAIGAGICHQLNLGHNAVSALMTRGIAEIARFGQRFGAHPSTFLGMAGFGDLSVTCMSPNSRNNTLGRKLASGVSLDEARMEMGMVTEGVMTCEIVHKIAQEFEIYMPITKAIHSILFEGISTSRALENLMQASLKDELH